MTHLWKNSLPAALFGLVVAVSAFVFAPSVASQTSQQKLTRDFHNAMETIRNSYVEEVPYANLARSGIQGMLRVLDPHSNYFDQRAFAEMNSEQRSHYFGIGAQIAVRRRGTFILETFNGTPAARAGLRYGDHIVAVDGVDTSNWTSDKVRSVLRGERLTPVRVTVARAGSPEPITVTMNRDSVALPSITSYYLARPEIGYINLSRGFHSTTNDELTQIMAELSEKGANSFILDLRGNPGGYLDQAIKVADRFLQRGQVIVSVRGREGKNIDRELTAEAGVTEHFPLVVLINRDSASASEIVAGAIQDHDRGLIIGESSFGKGLVQHIFPLRDGSGLTLTIARYFTPSGRLIQRDYSSGSLFEYHFRREQPGGNDKQTKPPLDEKRTDLGRTVYGGGGIEPDVKLENADTFNASQGRLYNGLFQFARDLTSGQVRGFEKFKINSINFAPGAKPEPYWIPDEVLKAYREYMAKFIEANPDYGLTMEQVENEMVWARKQIRQEVLWAAYGFDRMLQYSNDLDLQLQRAIVELPNSALLSARSWRAPAPSR
ncbi:MAG: S41 family peptidase [Acidobacteriota bacterium]